MRMANYLLMSLCVAVVSPAIAQQSPATSSAPQVAAPAAAPAAESGATMQPAGAAPTATSGTTAAPATPAVAAATAVDAVAADAAKRDAANDKVLRSRGYKPEVRNGHTLYCRKETPLGSRFESKICNTAEDVLRITQDAQDRTSEAQQRGEMTQPHN